MKKAFELFGRNVKEDLEDIIGGLSIVAILYSLYIVMSLF